MKYQAKPQSRNDLWCDSTVLGSRVYQEDLPQLLPKHRIALHDEVHQRVTENNERFRTIDRHIRRYGELPDDVDRSWWTSFKRHRSHLRGFYQIISTYIPDDKVALRNERVALEARRCEAARAQRFIKAQSRRTKDRQFIQVLCDTLIEEFGEEEIEPFIKRAGAVAKVLYELNPPLPTPSES